MLFVTIFLIILSIFFLVWGYRTDSGDARRMGYVFLLAAAGVGLITYISFSILV